jgi:hypothetical protein
MPSLVSSAYNALELQDSDKFIERHGERTIGRFLYAESTTQAIKMRHLPDTLIRKDGLGNDVAIKASSICNKATVRAFLKAEHLEGLTVISYRVPSLADGYVAYLRGDYRKKKPDAPYHLLERDEDLFWLKNMCIFGVAECIGWNKRDLGAFIDDRAATLADLGEFLRKVRGHTHETGNHIKKHHSDTEEIEDLGDTLQARITRMVEDLANRDLPGYALAPLPSGVPAPLVLPMGEKKRGKADE